MPKKILLAFCLVWLPIEVYGQGPLLWELREDIQGGTDFARAVTLSGKAAIVVGNAGVPQQGTDESNLFIQALGRPTGAIRWSDQAFLSTGTIEPLFVTSRQNRTYAVGTLREPGDVRSAFLVRAYDVSSGGLLWENIWHPSQGVDQDHPTGIFASATQVIVVGYGENATRDGLAALVRVCDPLTGAVLWENRDSRIGRELIAWSVVANRNRVFVAEATSPLGNLSIHDLIVRAYDAVSGDLVWETTQPLVSPTTLKLASGRLIVAGAASTATSFNTYLAAFSAKSGALLWEDRAPTTGFFRDIAIKESRIVSAAQSGRAFVVRTYDLITGNVEWEDRPTIPAGFGGAVAAVALNGDTVFAAGSVGEDFGASEFMVRAYDAGTGTLLWDDRSHPSLDTVAVDLALGKFRLFVVGYTSDGSTSTDLLIRAYDARVDTIVAP